MIILQVNGTNYEGFTKITAQRSYMSVPGSFSFTATTSPENVTTFPIANGDECKILVNDEPFITGYIDQLEITHNEGAHEINVQGRSKVADLVDSTMDGTYQISGPISLKAALTSLISKAGLSGVSVVDDTGVTNTFTKDETLSGKIGSPIWEFMVTLAIKKQVLLTEDGQGNVVMTRGYGEKLSDKLIKELNGTENNIKQSSCRRSQRERFNTYSVYSQQASTSLANIDITKLDATGTSDQNGKATDSAIRSSRVQCIMAEKASTTDQCSQRAIWQSNVKRVHAFSYSCTLQGFVNDAGAPFEPGMMPHVQDDFMQIDSDLIIDSVQITYDEDSGSNTQISFLLPDAFTLSATEPTVSTTGNDLTGIFSS